MNCFQKIRQNNVGLYMNEFGKIPGSFLLSLFYSSAIYNIHLFKSNSTEIFKSCKSLAISLSLDSCTKISIYFLVFF